MRRVILLAMLAMLTMALYCAAGMGARAWAAEGDAAHLFSEGNDHYAAGRFEDAVRVYRQLLAQGYTSEAVHYNLGNALFKSGQLGPAILEYEKAAVMAPDDDDLRANLEFLRTLTADKTSAGGAQTTTFFVERLLALTSLDEDAMVVLALFCIMGVLVAIRIVSTRPVLLRLALWGMAVVALPLVVMSAAFSVKLSRDISSSYAIVLSERLDVRSGPGDDNTTLFTVHEGLKVRLRGEQGGWLQVSLENGLNGWVPASSLGVI